DIKIRTYTLRQAKVFLQYATIETGNTARSCADISRGSRGPARQFRRQVCQSCDQRNAAARCERKVGRVLRCILRAHLLRHRAVAENFDCGKEAWTQTAWPCRPVDEFRRREVDGGTRRRDGRPLGENRRAGDSRVENSKRAAGFAAGICLCAWIDIVSAHW